MRRNASFKNKRFSFECPVHLFWTFIEFYETLIVAIGKRMFVISLDRIGEKSDPNHGLERRTKYDDFAKFKRNMCQENKKNIVVTTKQ